MSLALASLNAAPTAEFGSALADVFEHAPWVAEQAAAQRPYATVTALHGGMMAAVRNAPRSRQLEFVRAHPELGSKAARADLTAASQAEQGNLGLDRLSEAEFSRFQRLNAAYWDKFAFPFVICVGRHTRNSILQQFERRLDNSTDAEFDTALTEIGFITRLRLAAKVDGPGEPKPDGRLSTHVLDTTNGRPAQGVRIALYEVGDSARGLLVETVTNADGRTDQPLLAGAPLRIGTYELQFQIGDYFGRDTGDATRTVDRHTGISADDGSRRMTEPFIPRSAPPPVSHDGQLPFLDIVPVRFTIAEPEGHYHVPLLATPWSYTTYRGS